MHTFTATISIIGVNPFVEISGEILSALQKAFGKTAGPIPVKGTIEGKPYTHHVVKFSGLWRLYVNGPMIKASGKNVGDTATFTIAFDPKPRTVEMPSELKKALDQNRAAEEAFYQLPPYRQKEINRYISGLKSADAIQKNVNTVVRHLSGDKQESILFYERKKR